MAELDNIPEPEVESPVQDGALDCPPESVLPIPDFCISRGSSARNAIPYLPCTRILNNFNEMHKYFVHNLANLPRFSHSSELCCHLVL